MTAIVGFSKNNTVYMAGDTQGSSDLVKYEVTRPKVFKNGEFLFGYTSSFRFGDILEYIFVPPARAFDMTDIAYLIKYFIPELRECLEKHKYTGIDENGQSGNFLLGYRGHLYEVQGDFSIVEPTQNFASVGSGFAYCLGAMSVLVKTTYPPEDIVRKAVETSINHNPYVGGQVTVMVLEYKEGNRG